MDTRKFAMNHGAVLGVCLVLIASLFWMFGFDEQESVLPFIINNLLIVGFFYYSITYYRDNAGNGFISYSSSLKLGTSIAFFYSVIMAFYTFIYMSYLNPDFLTNFYKVAEQSILQSQPEIQEEELDRALQVLRNIMQPHFLMILVVLYRTFMGFFLSAILSFFIKRIDVNNIA